MWCCHKMLQIYMPIDHLCTHDTDIEKAIEKPIMASFCVCVWGYHMYSRQSSKRP